LRFVGVEVDEKVVDLVQDFLRARVGAINFVDDDDGLELGFESLGQGRSAFAAEDPQRVNEKHDTIDPFYWWRRHPLGRNQVFVE